MTRNNKKGLFVVFEGLDGSGSSTQASILHSNLVNLGYKSVPTKEPTNNLIGGLIRGQLTHEWSSNMETLQLLFAADRAHHLQKKIIPALEKKNIVISDRYFYSSIAYGSLETDTTWLKQINSKFIAPDITFLLRVAPSKVMKRMRTSRDQLELFEQEAKLKKVWKSYLALSKESSNVIIIDGHQKINAISEEILIHTKKLIPRYNIERTGELV